MPNLALSPVGVLVWTSVFIIAMCFSAFQFGCEWPLLLALPLVFFDAFRASRRWATELPPFIETVGELAVYGIRFADHGGSGYQWSHGDIELKVRLIIAESLGMMLESVRPETRWVDLAD
jgi:hypothetical protein